MKKRLLAIRSPSLINDLSTAISPCLPLGLAYIVAAIEDLVAVTVLDPIAEKPFVHGLTPFRNGTSILGLMPEETVARIKDAPEICLISSMFSMEWPVTRVLIGLLRKRFPGCVIIGGGEHFSAAADHSLLNSPLDICVLGEGEATVRELVGRLAAGAALPLGVPGTKEKHPVTKQILDNGRRPRIRNIEGLKYPAWEYFNVAGFLDRGVSNTGNGLARHRAMPIVASRGCPYECTFCSGGTMWGREWRIRRPEDVFGEMRYLVKRYGVNHFDFCDLTSFLERDWIVNFSGLLVRENLPVTWGLPSGTRAEVLDAEVLALLRRAGCNDLDYAPESGSDHILGIMRKKIDKEQVLGSMRACAGAGIKTKANIVLGYPEEKRRHVLETYRYILKMAFAGIDDLLVTSVSAYPGSELFEQLRREGRINMGEQFFLDLSSQGSLNLSPCYSRHYSKYEQYLFKMGGFVLFYLSAFIARPGRFVTLVRDILKGEGTSRLSMALLNLARRRSTPGPGPEAGYSRAAQAPGGRQPE